MGQRAGQSRLEQRKAKRRQEILAVAAQLFRTRGYDGTTADAIAEAVHLTKSALYTYVGSKEEIAVLLLQEVVRALLADAAAIDARPITPQEKIRDLIVRHVVVVGHHPASSLLFLHSEHMLSPEKYPHLYALRDQYEGYWRRWIHQAQEMRAIDVRSEKIAGWLILGSLNWVIRWFSPAGPFSAEDIGEEFARILLRGLGAQDGNSEGETHHVVDRGAVRHSRVD
ncbi:MAG: TetR/AcrR family transcriptional regulator [Firmicutes bacterium]|nr:TetR/AcrR family transcriptional regulator [Bacillota bacterium]